jgi:hypothetical protein
MDSREECLKHAADCREKAKTHPEQHDYWINGSVVWMERAMKSGRTKCDTVSAVLPNRFATRDQIATAMETGRNNGCFGTGPPRQADKWLE